MNEDSEARVTHPTHSGTWILLAFVIGVSLIGAAFIMKPGDEARGGLDEIERMRTDLVDVRDRLSHIEAMLQDVSASRILPHLPAEVSSREAPENETETRELAAFEASLAELRAAMQELSTLVRDESRLGAGSPPERIDKRVNRIDALVGHDSTELREQHFGWRSGDLYRAYGRPDRHFTSGESNVVWQYIDSTDRHEIEFHVTGGLVGAVVNRVRY